MVNTGEQELNGQTHLSYGFLYSHDFQNFIPVQISLLKFRCKYPVTHWTFSRGWRALKCISLPLSVSFSSSSHICYLIAWLDHPLGIPSQKPGGHHQLFSHHSINHPVLSVLLPEYLLIFPLLLSPWPIEHVYILTTIITHLNDHSISLSGLPSSNLCIYSVLSPEWTSKMKSLTIRFQIDHHPFQWLSIDLKVNLEHLTLAYKTLYDLTPGHSSDWSFRWVVVLSHLCNLVIPSLL